MMSQFNYSVGDMPTHLNEEEYHRDIAIVMTPGMVIFRLVMLIGLFGNILVLYVYTFRLKRSTTNLFIIALAVSDIFFCSVCIPVEIIVIRYLYSFDKPWVCRVMRTIVMFCVFCAISVLITIAVDRYKIICTPFTKQITIKGAKIAITICCVSSSLLAAPAMVILGSRTINRTFTGHACTTDDSMIQTPYPGLFNGIQFLVAVVGTTTITVLYSLILRKVKTHESHKKGPKKTKQIRYAAGVEYDKSGKKKESANTTSQSKRCCPIISTARNTSSNRETTYEDVSRSDNITASLDDETVIGDDVTSSPHKCFDVNIMAANKSNLKPKRSHKTTLMMFLVTAVVVISFIPHLGLMAIRAVQKHTFEHLEGASLATYNIFLRVFFINSASNPIIYSFLSDKFRREVNILFKRPTPQPAAV